MKTEIILLSVLTLVVIFMLHFFLSGAIERNKFKIDKVLEGLDSIYTILSNTDVIIQADTLVYTDSVLIFYDENYRVIGTKFIQNREIDQD